MDTGHGVCSWNLFERQAIAEWREAASSCRRHAAVWGQHKELCTAGASTVGCTRFRLSAVQLVSNVFKLLALV